MPSTGRFVRLLLLLVCLVPGAGCSQLKLSRSIAWLPEAEEPAETPAKVVALWTNAVLQQPNRPPTRGFSGKLMFFAARENKPVPVDGSLVVYAFVEEGRAASEVKPDRKFVFTPEQFAGHYGKSKLGHSYSVWLPWDEAGGPQTEISLIARFTPTEGATIVGEQTKHVLPGATTTPEAGRRDVTHATRNDARGETSENAVRPTAYEADLEATDPPAGEPTRTLDVETIAIPPRFGRAAPVARTGKRPIRPTTGPEESTTASSSGEASAPAGQASSATTEGQPEDRPQAQPALPRPARFALARPRPPAGPTARSIPDRAPWRPRPVKWPSRPAPRRPAASASESESSSPAMR